MRLVHVGKVPGTMPAREQALWALAQPVAASIIASEQLSPHNQPLGHTPVAGIVACCSAVYL